MFVKENPDRKKKKFVDCSHKWLLSYGCYGWVDGLLTVTSIDFNLFIGTLS